MKVRDLTKLPIFDASYANCEPCELQRQCERGMSCAAYRPSDFNGVMIIGEGPGQQEVTQRRPFVGKSGLLLRSFLAGSGIDLDRCYITNATLAKPPPKDKALHDEFPNAIPSCLGRLEAEIEAVRPTVIIVLGAAAWIAVSGRDEHKSKRVAFDCEHCNENRKVGPALQCNGSVPNPADGGATAVPCHHSYFFQKPGPLPLIATSVDPDELAEAKAAGCQKCGASLKKLRPKMVACLVCGGYKMREEPYVEFTWDFSLTKIAGAVFEPAEEGATREPHQLDSWYAQQGVKYVVPTYHPSYLMRGQQFLAKTFNKHLIHACRLLDGAAPVVLNHRTTDDPEVLREFIYRERDWSPLPGPNFTVDIETEAIIDEKAEDARKIRNVTAIKCIGFATPTEQLVVDTRNVRPDNPDDLLLQAIYDVLVDETIAKTYHNGAGYDIPVIDLIWAIPWFEQIKSYHDDTQYAHKNLYPDEPHDLAHVTFESTMTRAWKPPRVSNGAQVHKDFEELALYNARDVHHTALSRDHLGVSHGKVVTGGRMDRAHLGKVYAIDSRIRKITIGMTMRGMPLNKAVFHKAGEIASKNVADATTSIHTALKAAGVPNSDQFNPNSGPQTIELLFGPTSFFKLTALDRTDKGDVSTSKTSLVKVMSTPQAANDKHALTVLNGLLTLRTQSYIDRNYIRSPSMQPWSDGRIHALWQGWGTKTGRMSSSPNCFDGETEVLTPAGWVRFDAIDPTVHKKIAQYDNSGTIRFVAPIRWIKKWHEGPMVHLYNQHTELLLTPDHDCLLRDRKTGAFKVIKAAEYPEDHQQLHAGKLTGGAAHLSEAEIGLLCAIQADGYMRPELSAVDFKFTRPRKIERFRKIIRTLGFTVKETEFARDAPGSNYKTGWRFYVPRNEIARTGIGPYLDSQKRFTWELLQLSTLAREYFCKEIIHWDGSQTKGRAGFNYSSSIELNVDIVQTMLSLSGIRAHKRVYLGSKNPNYQIDAVPRDCSMTTNIGRSTVDWADHVYCVTVPSSHVVVRRKGKVCITNQCQNWPIWLRDSVEAPNGRMIVGADADQLELRNIAHLSGDAEMVRRVLTADEKRKLEPDCDPHSFVASIAFGEGYTGLHLKDPTHTDKSAGGDKSKKCRCQTCQRKAKRDLIKRVIYGLNYGAGALTVLEAIYDGGYEGPPITLSMVEHVQKVIFRVFSGIPRFRDTTLATAKLEGGIFSPLHGRRRIFPLPEELGGSIPATEIYNYPIQSYAGDLVNEMIVAFDDALLDIDPTAFIIAQVHDAIYAECAEKHAEAVSKLLKECMTMSKTINGLTMNFTSSSKINKRWGALAA